MIEQKIINETELSPRITLDVDGNIGISGKSRMEDASLFYKDILSWINEFIENVKKPLTVKLKLNYFNSSSAKQILKLLMLIDEAEIDGKVIWIYPNDNDVLLERGEELQIMLDLPFEYVAYADDEDYKMP